MPSLPAVFIELKATSTEFMAKMKEAQGEIKKTADVAQSSNDRMASVGKVAFAGLAAAAVGFGAVAVKAALEGQQAHAQLVQAVENSGTAFESVGGSVDAMSGSFAKLGFENDQVEAAMTRMVTATGSTKTAMDNMGLAADLARARHIGLEEASNALGKVLAGNMKGMTVFGLSAKDASGHVLTTSQAVAELNARFGGAAQANAGTYAGKLQALNAELHNATEAIGNMLLPVLADMAGVLANTVGWFERHRAAAEVLAGIIGGPLVVAMSAFIAKQAVAFTLSTIDTVKKVGAAIMTFLVPATEAEATALTTAAIAESVLTFGLAAAAGAAAIAGIAALNHASANNDVASTAGDATGAVAGLTGGEGDLGTATATTTGVLKEQAGMFEQLNGNFDAQGSEILKLIGDQQSLDRASQTLAGSTKTNTQATKDAKTADENLTAARKKLTDATDAYNKLSTGLTQAISKDHVSLQHNLTQAQLSNEEAQKKVNDAVAEYGPNSFEARQANLDLESSYIDLQAAQEAMGHEGEDAWNKVNDAQQKVTDAGQGVQDAIDKQTEAVGKLKQPSSDVAANTLAWQQAQSQLNTDWGVFNKMIEDHPDLVPQLAGWVKTMRDNMPKGADTKPLDDILTMLQRPIPPKSLAAAFFDPVPAGSGLATLTTLSAIGAVMPISSALTGGVLGGLFAPPAAGPAGPTVAPGPAPAYALPAFGVPRAAEGAMVKAQPGGKLMLVGEGGQDEAIVPLDKMGSMGGGVTVVVNVAGSVLTEQDLINLVRDGLLKAGRNMVGVGLG